MGIRFINKEILSEKMKNDTQSLFENYSLFNTYNFKPTIRILEMKEDDVQQVSDKDLNEHHGENPDNTKVYI